ncbi:hypothetical protein K438DRAFT_1932718 [Mycena galopus ATCC 62051]|nr:hypothetical protein K438DRAFT_1932718 [Mycena galopus ATCC 62051]
MVSPIVRTFARILVPSRGLLLPMTKWSNPLPRITVQGRLQLVPQIRTNRLRQSRSFSSAEDDLLRHLTDWVGSDTIFPAVEVEMPGAVTSITVEDPMRLFGVLLGRLEAAYRISAGWPKNELQTLAYFGSIVDIISVVTQVRPPVMISAVWVAGQQITLSTTVGGLDQDRKQAVKAYLRTANLFPFLALAPEPISTRHRSREHCAEPPAWLQLWECAATHGMRVSSSKLASVSLRESKITTVEVIARSQDQQEITHIVSKVAPYLLITVDDILRDQALHKELNALIIDMILSVFLVIAVRNRRVEVTAVLSHQLQDGVESFDSPHPNSPADVIFWGSAVSKVSWYIRSLHRGLNSAVVRGTPAVLAARGYSCRTGFDSPCPSEDGKSNEEIFGCWCYCSLQNSWRSRVLVTKRHCKAPNFGASYLDIHRSEHGEPIYHSDPLIEPEVAPASDLSSDAFAVWLAQEAIFYAHEPQRYADAMYMLPEVSR